MVSCANILGKRPIDKYTQVAILSDLWFETKVFLGNITWIIWLFVSQPVAHRGTFLWWVFSIGSLAILTSVQLSRATSTNSRLKLGEASEWSYLVLLKFNI